jgi:predicted Ser/Thr protein kinase
VRSFPGTLSRVTDPAAASDAELREHVQQTLAATYEVEREIGRGGMGVVYRAIDKRLKRPVAIKLLPPELAFRRDIRQRFQREAETAAQLSHPNIVPIYSVDEVGNLVFFVMACVDGDNLAVQLRTRGPLPPEEVRRYLTEVADALAYAHTRGVIHRDIKPDNILVDAIDGRAMVTDFGIARAAEGGEGARLTATGLAIGTPAYMSPEQASGDRDVDGRSDLYSLGVVAYQMLTGVPPFAGNATPVLLVKHLAEMPLPVEERRPDVPPMLAAMVMRLLEKDPDHRFQSAAEFAQVLRSGIVPPEAIAARSRAGEGAVGASGPMGVAADARPSRSPGGVGLPPLEERPGSPLDERRAMSRQLAERERASAPSTAAARVDRSVAAAGYQPAAEELVRWESAPVSAFRRKVAPFLFVNGVLVAVSVIARENFLPITAIWSIVLAYKYAKLWSDGYDWRDVLRQPKDRMFGDVIADVGESIEATFSKQKREQLRAEGRTGSGLLGSLSPRSPVPAGAGGPVGVAATGGYGASDFGRHGETVTGARTAREEIARLLATLPPADRARIPDVATTAVQLTQKVEQLVVALAACEEALGARSLAAIEDEIATLEAAANPLDAGSEARVRRLATLRRERRATLDLEARREEHVSRLDACTLALENMRLDLVRLRTGGGSTQSVTQVAEAALALARDVDRVVEAAQEVRSLTTARSGRA